MKKIILFTILIAVFSISIYLINENRVADKVLGTMMYGSNNTAKKQSANKDKKIVFETQKLYSLINSYRKDNKVSPLQVDKSLEISAKRKVADMIENNYFKHEDEDNIESWYLFKTAGYEYKTAGENLSSGANTPWKVFDAWKNSEIHNAQLLNETYLDMGINVDCESYKIAKRPSCIAVLHLGSK